jgi:RNA polymerase sigma-70 factor (family 1)
MESRIFDDRDLVESLRNGSEESFTIIYHQYHRYLYYFSLRFVKSPALAEEVVHDVFLKVWENRERLKTELSFKGYLIKITKNHVLNLLARASREEKIRSEILYFTPEGSEDTENSIYDRDYQKHAEEIISMLPEQRQRIFRMYRYDDMSGDEIAVLLNISKGTVKDHLLKANRFIRKHLHRIVPLSSDLFIVLFIHFM